MTDRKIRKDIQTNTLSRRDCSVEGCTRHGRNKGFHNGKQIYGNLCEFHHKAKRGKISKPNIENKFLIPNDKCEKCGWNLAPCDRHRIDPLKGYFRENVLVLCPNCHRLEHHKTL